MSSRRRALPIFGGILAVLGLIVVVVCGGRTAVLVGKPLSQTLTSPVRQAPVTASLHFDQGTYLVFERTGRVSGGGSFTQIGTTTLTPADVTVTGPGGRQLTSTGPGAGNQTVTRQQVVYTAAVRFVVPAAGTYQLAVTSGQQAAFIVGPSLGTGFHRAVGWIGGAVIGGLVLVLGVVLLVIGLFRRRGLRSSGLIRPELVQSGSAGPGGSAGSGEPAGSAGSADSPWSGAPGGYRGSAGSDQAGWDPQAPYQGRFAQPVPPAPTGLPPEGWYPDPHPETDPVPEPGPDTGAGSDARPPDRLRYWDGAAWTRRVR